MAGRAAVLRRRMLLGQQVSPQVAQSIEQSLSDTFQGPLPTSGQGTNWTWADLLQAADSGNVPADVKAQIVQQNAQGLVQAGMDPAEAAQQALSDVNQVLSTFTGAGAFGINWTGAQPGGPNWLTQLETNAGNALGVNTGTWIWWALGGVGALFLLSRASR